MNIYLNSITVESFSFIYSVRGLKTRFVEKKQAI